MFSRLILQDAESGLFPTCNPFVQNLNIGIAFLHVLGGKTCRRAVAGSASVEDDVRIPVQIGLDFFKLAHGDGTLKMGA